MQTSQRVRNAAEQLPLFSLLMVAAALVIAIIPDAADRLQLDRSAVLQHGSLWQFVTCHWTHWSVSHLFWDCLALGVLACLCERENRARFLSCVAISVPVIPLVLWFTEPWMLTYRGLSGIDSALFALLVTMLMQDAVRRGDRPGLVVGGLVFAAFACKVGYEFLAGQTVFVDSAATGMVPVPMAHVVGAITGLLSGIVPIRQALFVARDPRSSVRSWLASQAEL
jgi:rhomboid family GlyGly-CTERM serine protease